MVTRLAEKDFGAFGAFEPQMRIVIPREADAAMNLNTLGCGAYIRVRGRGLGQTGDSRPFRVIYRGGLSRLSRSPCQSTLPRHRFILPCAFV